MLKAPVIVGLCFSLLTLASMDAARADDSEIQKRLDSYLRLYAAAGEFSGVALIANDRGLLAKTLLGYSDFKTRVPLSLKTRFRIASLSKTFTAAAISILNRQGKLKLSDPLSNFFPDFPNGKAITIEHLLLHRSGVGALYDPRYVLSVVPLDNLVTEIAKQPTLFPPGTKGQYSNEGYVLLAGIIEKASGKSYAQYVKDAILTPLQLGATGVTLKDWAVDPHASGYIASDGVGGVVPAATVVTWPGPGALHSTASDLLSWLKAFRANRFFDFASQHYPYGWGKRTYEGKAFVQQSGEIEGYVAYMALYPQDGYYVVLLSNIESGLQNRLESDISKVIFGGSPSVPPQIVPQPMSLSQSAAFPGSYHSSVIPVPAKISQHDGKLVQSWDDSPFAHPLVAISPDKVFGPVDFATISLVRGTDGAVTGTDWSWDGSPPLPMTR
jgi:CubicO group peptidase (beta-lactamase class C family)